MEASGALAGFEIWGILGALLAGWLSDRFFSRNRGTLNALYMGVLSLTLLLFWLNPGGTVWFEATMLFAAGFFVYGPQMLVGVCAADTVRRSQAATATGLTGLFGYVFGATASGLGAGWVVDHYGWTGGFVFFISCALIGMVLFLLYRPQHE